MKDKVSPGNSEHRVIPPVQPRSWACNLKLGMHGPLLLLNLCAKFENAGQASLLNRKGCSRVQNYAVFRVLSLHAQGSAC